MFILVLRFKPLRKLAFVNQSPPVILIIKAKLAYQSGIGFYEGNDKVWLSDVIPPEFIKFPG